MVATWSSATDEAGIPQPIELYRAERAVRMNDAGISGLDASWDEPVDDGAKRFAGR